MTDPKQFLDGILTLSVNLDAGAIVSAAITMAGLMGFHRALVYFRRGKRLGSLAAPLAVERPRGGLKRWLGSIGLADAVTDGLVQGFFALVFLVFTYFSLDKLDLPFKPIVPGLAAVFATANLYWIARSHRGRCVCYENGLLIEGVYYSYLKVGIEGAAEGVALTFGKAKLPMSLAAFERSKALIRDTSLHVQFERLRTQPSGQPGKVV